MARLDKLIQVMHEQDAGSLQLEAGKPAALLIKGTPRPVTREPLSPPQIFSLLQEIAPAKIASQIPSSPQSAFAYTAPSGSTQVEVSAGSTGVVAILRAAPGATAGAAAPPRAKPSGAVRVESAPSTTATADLGGARKQVDDLLRLLVESRASDLHLRSGEPPILRLDGALGRRQGETIGAERLAAMISSIMQPRDLAEFNESGDADWAYDLPGVARFRCNAGQERTGPLAVFRVIPAEVLTADQLGLSAEIQKLCYLTKGLVVVTGPTGCGKSTTLAALVDLMNRTRTDHIITIEDPIEFVHQSKRCVVTQRQVGQHTRSFKQALRAALREDPDIILVGEMRDLETVSIAIETAETGHLVFGTLHTTTAASTIDRIIDQFPVDRQSQIRVMLAESLRGVIAQVLCRKIGGGRVAAREILLSIPAVSNLIREGKTFQIPSIMQTNRKVGMVPLSDALLELVDARAVEPKEAYMKAVDKNAFAAALKAKRHDISFLGE